MGIDADGTDKEVAPFLPRETEQSVILERGR